MDVVIIVIVCLDNRVKVHSVVQIKIWLTVSVLQINVVFTLTVLQIKGGLTLRVLHIKVVSTLSEDKRIFTSLNFLHEYQTSHFCRTKLISDTVFFSFVLV